MFSVTWKRQGQQPESKQLPEGSSWAQRVTGIPPSPLQFRFQHALPAGTHTWGDSQLPWELGSLVTSFFHVWKLLCHNPLTSAKPGPFDSKSPISNCDYSPLLQFVDLLHINKEHALAPHRMASASSSISDADPHSAFPLLTLAFWSLLSPIFSLTF